MRSLSGEAMLASHGDLVQHLREEGRLEENRVRDAYQAVDRRHFVEASTPKAFTYMVLYYKQITSHVEPSTPNLR